MVFHKWFLLCTQAAVSPWQDQTVQMAGRKVIRLVLLALFAVLDLECVVSQQTPPEELAAARVADPDTVMGVLRELSLDSAGHWRADMAALNTAEQEEMVAALQRGGVPLGDRSRLRVWVNTAAWGASLVNTTEILLTSPTRLYVTSEKSEQRRLQQEVRAEESSSINLETMAIIFTGLLGVIGYVVQSKIARDQLTATRNHDLKMSLE